MLHTTTPFMMFLNAHAASHPVTFEALVQSNIFNVVIAFSALAFIIKKFNVGGLLEKRQSFIVAELKDAEAKRDQAMKDLAEIEARSAKLKQEVETMLQDAEKTAASVADSILSQAQDEASRLISTAQKRIEQEEKQAARDLEQRLMIEAIHGARQLLESTLSKDDQIASVEAFIEQLPELLEKELKA